MCNMNENEGIIRNVNACKEAFDRILILDSSSTDNHIKLKSDLSNIDKLTIQRIIPMGTQDFILEYGRKIIGTEYLFQIDADEQVSESLLRYINEKKFKDFDYILLKRFETAGNLYTSNHKRLFRISNGKYTGYPDYGPSLNGHFTLLPEEYCLIHNSDFFNYTSTKGRNSRYFTIRAMTNPLTTSIVRARTRSRLVKFLMGKRNKIISRPIAISYFLILAMSRFKRGFSAKEIIFWFKIEKGAYSFFRNSDPDFRILCLELSVQILIHGGPIQYLCLDDENYVPQLSNDLKLISGDGINNFVSLCKYRLSHGKCLSPQNHSLSNNL